MTITATAIYGASPIVMNAATLATDNQALSPDLAAAAYRHSGNLFPSVITAPGGAPRVRFTTPFFEAYTLIGLQSLKLTTFEFYLAKFTDAIRLTTTARKYSLASSAVGITTITGFRVSQNGILLCDVEVVLLSSDGMTNPLTSSDAGTLPALGSQPALRTLGPHVINGTNYASATSISCDLGNTLTATATGGSKYPTVAMYEGGDPTFTVEDADAATMLSALTLEGVALSSNFVAYFRDYSTTTGLTLGTGLSMTVASGRIFPGDAAAPTQGLAASSFRVVGLSSSATHPIIIASGATVPT